MNRTVYAAVTPVARKNIDRAAEFMGENKETSKIKSFE